MEFSAINRVPKQYAAEGVRPQTLLFTVLGRHVLERDEAVAASTFIEILARLDVSVQAARTTLTRMVRRGHLVRHPVGRRVFFSVSAKLRAVLEQGGRRIFDPPVREHGGESWTLLSFSIPEGQRSDRHSLRTALAWHGFGPLRSGLWLAPGDVDVTPIVDRLGLQGRLETFRGRPAPPTDLHRVVADAWDLDVVSDDYHAFIDRWKARSSRRDLDPLAEQIRLITEWQQILVGDPGLPSRYLPDRWPALDAFDVFCSEHAELSPAADRAFRSALEVVPLGDLDRA